MKSLVLWLCLAAAAVAQAPHFVYPVPPESSFTRRNVAYMSVGNETYTFDLYKPVAASSAVPVVIFVNAVGKMLGDAPFREHPQYVGWGKVITASGYAAIVMESDPQNPVRSFDQLIANVQKDAGALGVDPNRIVIYSCSSNVQAGIPILTDPARSYLKGALVFYGYGTVNQYRMDLPVMVFRAGLDSRNLNTNLDTIVAGALRRNAPWSLANGSALHHGFEVVDDTDQSRAFIRQALTFISDAFNPRLQSTASMLTESEAAGFAFSGDWKKAAEAYERMVAADPANSFGHWRLAEALAALSDHQRAIDHFRRALELGNQNVGIISVAAAKEAIALGKIDVAFEFLDKVKTIRVVASRLKDDPAFATLRNDPRFQQIVGP